MPRPIALLRPLLVAAAFSFPAPTGVAVPGGGAAEPPGLVSRWRAEGNANDELGANHGAPVGSVSYAPGAEGQAFSLDGSGFIQIGSPTFDAQASAFTVVAWIRMSEFVGGSAVINHRTAANDGGFTLEQFFGQPGTMLFSINSGGNAQPASFQQVSSSGWNSGVLYHVAATFDAATW